MTEKTTIRNIDPDVLWDAKIYAAQTKQTMGEVVTLALCKLVHEDEHEEEVELFPELSTG